MTKQENNEDNKGMKQNNENMERIMSPADRELSPSPTLLPISRRPSHYDAMSGIYIGPSRKLSDDESLLASLAVQEDSERSRRSKDQERASPLPVETVDPLSGVYIGSSLTEEDEEDKINNPQTTKPNNLKIQTLTKLIVTKDGKEWF